MAGRIRAVAKELLPRSLAPIGGAEVGSRMDFGFHILRVYSSRWISVSRRQPISYEGELLEHGQIANSRYPHLARQVKRVRDYAKNLSQGCFGKPFWFEVQV